jgi:hypothetical protein
VRFHVSIYLAALRYAALSPHAVLRALSPRVLRIFACVPFPCLRTGMACVSLLRRAPLRAFALPVPCCACRGTTFGGWSFIVIILPWRPYSADIRFPSYLFSDVVMK